MAECPYCFRRVQFVRKSYAGYYPDTCDKCGHRVEASLKSLFLAIFLQFFVLGSFMLLLNFKIFLFLNMLVIKYGFSASFLNGFLGILFLILAYFMIWFSREHIIKFKKIESE
jgi:hypothetical protein